jgi:hypothetical protein
MQQSPPQRRPNPPLQLTPLRGRKIAAILKSGNSPNALPIYRCGATERHTVRPLGNVVGNPFS